MSASSAARSARVVVPRSPHADRVRVVAELSRPASPTSITTRPACTWTSSRTTSRSACRARSVPSPVIGGFGAVSTPIAQQSVSQVPPRAGAQAAHLSRRHRRLRLQGRADPRPAPHHRGHRPRQHRRARHDRREGHRAPQARAVGPGARGDPRVARPVVPPRGQPVSAIAPRKELDAEDEEEAARREARGQGRGAARRGRHAQLRDRPPSSRRKLEGMLSPKGHIEVDERTNALIVNDVAGNREQIARARASASTRRRRRSRSRRASSRRARRSCASSASSGAVARSPAPPAATRPASCCRRRSACSGGNDDAHDDRAPASRRPSDFAVNLPAATGTGEGGALGLSLGSVGGNFNINLRLSALEDTGYGPHHLGAEDHGAQQQGSEDQPGRVDPDLGRVGRRYADAVRPGRPRADGHAVRLAAATARSR